MNQLAHTASAKPWRPRRLLGVGVLLVLAVWISAEASRFFAIAATDDASVIWPPLGIALAAALSMGRRVIPCYAALIGVWFAYRGYGADVCLLMALEQGAALLAVTEVTRRWVGTSLLSTLGAGLRFYFYAIMLALLPFAGVAALAYSRMGFFQDLGYVNIWIFHWLSEAMGVALFAPPGLYMIQWLKEPWRPVLNRVDALFWLGFAALLAATLTAGFTGHFNYARGFAYLFFPLLIAGGLAGRVLSALVMLPLAVITTVLTVYFGTWQTEQAAWNALGEALAFSAVLGIITQLVVASTVERTDLIRYLRAVNLRDQLTGEFNRRGLVERMENDNPDDADTDYVAATLCLRNFAHVRELLPDPVVDQCERWVLERMREQLRGHYLDPVLARVDNGVYALVVATRDPEAVRRCLGGLIHRLKGHTFGAEDSQYQVEPTIGALPFRRGESVADVLTATFHMAREAMNTPGRPLHFGQNYQQLLEVSRGDLRQLETFKRALNRDVLILFGQEIRPLDPQGGRSKVEFLVRMEGDDGEILSPAAFMPVASRFGYMADLDRRVIRNAFRAVARRLELLDTIAQFSINLSGATLSDRQSLDYIRDVLHHSGLDADRFCFEVTETEAIEDWEQALTILEGIKALGCAVSLDDFGTGLASFDYLNRFDFDYVKIDGSFVRNLDTDTRNREVVEAVVLVAHRRGIHTIAEFVENETIAQELARLGVDYVQGFGIHRPAPLDTLG